MDDVNIDDIFGAIKEVKDVENDFIKINKEAIGIVVKYYQEAVINCDFEKQNELLILLIHLKGIGQLITEVIHNATESLDEKANEMIFGKEE